MDKLCTYLLQFSTEKFTNPLSESDKLYYLHLLNEGGINSICDTYGNTPLHFAWMSGQAHLIVPLLEMDALYVRNNIKCFPNELGLFPQQMATVIDRLWRVAILDPEGTQLIQDAVDIASANDIFFNKNFTASMQENIDSYRTFFARHHSWNSYKKVCKLSCNIVEKMMSGEIDCNWFVDNV